MQMVGGGGGGGGVVGGSGHGLARRLPATSEKFRRNSVNVDLVI